VDQGVNPVPRGASPKVTVLMSCYNGSRWLHEAIESVLCQTFENFEFILIDDGSTDETWDIIRAYRDRDQRIFPVRKENTGLQDSLNVGIAHAKGEWIARLDADDLCEPDRLAEQLRYAHNHPEIVLLGACFVEIDAQGRSVKKQLYPSGHRELLCHLERLQRFFPHSSAFFRRDIAQDIGLYNRLFRKSQDWDLWLRFAERGRIACVRNCLVRVRKHSEQISNATAGTSQLVYGTAASTCHFLRIDDCPDPSSDSDETVWKGFLEWIEGRITEEGAFEKRKVWADARDEYFATNNRIIGAFQLGTRLLKSGHAVALMWEKVFGSSLPKRLARERMKHSCADSETYDP
jgi:glycosyltransferase involved in cell wall biosynthesis